jgi:hypothetical protein
MQSSAVAYQLRDYFSFHKLLRTTMYGKYSDEIQVVDNEMQRAINIFKNVLINKKPSRK